MEAKRLTAIKSNIESIMGGEFHPAEGFNSAYVLTPTGQKLSRVRVMATIVGKFVSDDGNYATINLDDESENIRVKVFKDTSLVDDVDVGDIVDVFGKVREYNDEIYIAPEIVRKIEDPNFLILRMAELSVSQQDSQKTREKIEQLKTRAADLDEVKKLAEAEGIDTETVENIAEAEENSDKKSAKEVILNLLDELNEEDGTEYGTMIEKSGLDEAEVDDAVNELLSEGTCYEPRPGRIKKL